MYSFNLYDRFANFRDCSKAWQMKLKLWHLILQEIVKISSGRKNQTFCQIYVLKFLKLAHYFSHSSECKPISDIHPKHTDHCFQFFSNQIWSITNITRIPLLMATIIVAKDKREEKTQKRNGNGM